MIISIDPGYDRFGLAFVEKENGNYKLIHSECITTSKTQEYSERISHIGTQLSHAIKKFKPDILAIESVFFSNNQKTVLKISEVRGMVLYIATVFGLPVIDLTPLEVKMSITGYGRATKDQILYMLPHLITLDSAQKYLDDELDAIAIGIAAFDYKSRLKNK